MLNRPGNRSNSSSHLLQKLPEKGSLGRARWLATTSPAAFVSPNECASLLQVEEENLPSKQNFANERNK
jgi:hypothetical protein